MSYPLPEHPVRPAHTHIMVSRLFSTLLLLAGHLCVSRANSKFIGQGYIQVLASNNITAAKPSDRIGCMHETGALTLSDCGVFTKDGNGLTSRLGNCTFNDDTQPANVDAIYGQRNYAWVCRNGVDNWLYYSFVSVRRCLTALVL